MFITFYSLYIYLIIIFLVAVVVVPVNMFITALTLEKSSAF